SIQCCIRRKGRGDPRGGREDRETAIMRQIGTLADEETARVFADYLLTLHVETQLMPEPEGWAVWVCDEDRVGQARQALDEFTRNPAGSRYKRAASAAVALREQEVRAEEDYRRRQRSLRPQFAAPSGARPLTVLLVVACIVVGVVSGLGENTKAL